MNFKYRSLGLTQEKLYVFELLDKEYLFRFIECNTESLIKWTLMNTSQTRMRFFGLS